MLNNRTVWSMHWSGGFQRARQLRRGGGWHPRTQCSAGKPPFRQLMSVNTPMAFGMWEREVWEIWTGNSFWKQVKWWFFLKGFMFRNMSYSLKLVNFQKACLMMMGITYYSLHYSKDFLVKKNYSFITIWFKLNTHLSGIPGNAPLWVKGRKVK